MTLLICILHSDRDVFFVHGVKPAVKKSLHVTNSSSNFFSFELERKVLLLAWILKVYSSIMIFICHIAQL